VDNSPALLGRDRCPAVIRLIQGTVDGVFHTADCGAPNARGRNVYRRCPSRLFPIGHGGHNSATGPGPSHFGVSMPDERTLFATIRRVLQEIPPKFDRPRKAGCATRAWIVRASAPWELERMRVPPSPEGYPRFRRISGPSTATRDAQCPAVGGNRGAAAGIRWSGSCGGKRQKD